MLKFFTPPLVRQATQIPWTAAPAGRDHEHPKSQIMPFVDHVARELTGATSVGVELAPTTEGDRG